MHHQHCFNALYKYLSQFFNGSSVVLTQPCARSYLAVLLMETLCSVSVQIDQPLHGESGTIHLLKALLPAALITTTAQSITPGAGFESHMHCGDCNEDKPEPLHAAVCPYAPTPAWLGAKCCPKGGLMTPKLISPLNRAGSSATVKVGQRKGPVRCAGAKALVHLCHVGAVLHKHQQLRQEASRCAGCLLIKMSCCWRGFPAGHGRGFHWTWA